MNGRRPRGAGAPYRFGFALNTTLGNMTRYLNLRKYGERVTGVECVWAPANHYTPPEVRTRLRVLPAPLFMRARILQQSAPVLRTLASLDAVMIHLFEVESLCALRSLLVSRPLLFSSTDEAPESMEAPAHYPGSHRSTSRRRLRATWDRWRIQRMDGFIPFSQRVADGLIAAGARADRVTPIHVGLDLERWLDPGPRTLRESGPVRLLFVGGDFARKGGPLLLEVFAERFTGVAELHLVSQQAPTANLPSGVFVYRDLVPNDPRIIELYRTADAFVVPTLADTGPLWSYLEAMAMRLPVIGTRTGANAEIVLDGTTGLMVRPGDKASLGAALEHLIADGASRIRMGAAGRHLVDASYSAATNVPRIFDRMKVAVESAVSHG